MNASDTTDVRVGHFIDTERLSRYLDAHLAGFKGPISIRQFAGGQSNPTYVLTTPAAEYVLRKKPNGALLPGAHAVEREHQILTALAETPVPVPRLFHMCRDVSILGTSFYIMENVRGRVFRHASLPGSTPADRAAIYDAMSETAARLHSIDWAAVGLSEFGRHDNYIARQIRLWTRQYQASKTHEIAAMDRLVDWLPQNIPDDDATTIAHGDFRLENLIFHPIENRVVAIIDWELATLGHPLSDMAFNCMVYHVPPEMSGIRGIAGLDLADLGIPSEEEYLRAYCKRVNRNGIRDWDFYLAFAMFRSAAILQGVYARALQGSASNADALSVGKAAAPLADIAWSKIGHQA